MRFSILAIACLLAACAPEESEQACFDKINKDLGGYATRAKSLGDSKGAIQAYESVLAASLIHGDDDRNVCDYVTAGPVLQRK